MMTLNSSSKSEKYRANLNENVNKIINLEFKQKKILDTGSNLHNNSQPNFKVRSLVNSALSVKSNSRTKIKSKICQKIEKAKVVNTSNSPNTKNVKSKMIEGSKH